MENIQKYKWEIILVVIASLILFTPIKSHLKRIFSLAKEIKVEDTQNLISTASENLVFEGYKTNNTSLKDHKGKVIFLHFWGSWCGDCRLEMPDLNTFYEKNKTKISFIMVAIEKGNKEEKLTTYFKENPQFTFPVYTEPTQFTSQLNPTQYPTTYIIDTKGNIITKKIGATDWNSPEIQKLIDQLIP